MVMSEADEIGACEPVLSDQMRNVKLGKDAESAA